MEPAIQNKETRTQEGGRKTPEHPEGKMAGKTKPNQNQLHRKGKGLNQRREGSRSNNPPQKGRHTTQNGPKPKRNKTEETRGEDIDLSD